MSLARRIGPLALATLIVAAPAAGRAQAVAVQVDKQGEQIELTVTLDVPVPLPVAWSVLTDYDHMAEFLTTLKSSAVVARDGASLVVEQTAEAWIAFFRIDVHTLRAVQLEPMHDIRSQLIAGDFETYSYTTHVVDLGGRTRITHHGRYVPKSWVPPGIGPSIIRLETTRQFEQLAAEMRRRLAVRL